MTTARRDPAFRREPGLRRLFASLTAAGALLGSTIAVADETAILAIAERPGPEAPIDGPFAPAEAEQPFEPAVAEQPVVPSLAEGPVETIALIGFEVAVAELPEEPAIAERPEAATDLESAGASFEPAVAEVPDSALPVVHDIGNVGRGMTPAEPVDLARLEGRAAIEFTIRALEEGSRKLAEVPDYTAEFFKRERVGGVLDDGTTMVVKLRHEPFSIYLKWLSGDKGREIIYVDGENDGEMLFHPGGWKARLLPPLKIRPDGDAALKHSRHPVTQFGLVNLAKRVIERRSEDLDRGEGVHLRIEPNQKFADRDCWRLTVEYDSPKVSDYYRKAIVWIDSEYSVPVCVFGYGWPTETVEADRLDEATLIEHYEYTSIRLNQRLADLDFDRRNKEYNFRR